MQDEFWQLASAFIATDTALPRGNTALEPLVRQALAPLGGRLECLPASHAGQSHFNYLASFGPDEPGGLLLVTHLDTVPAGPPERWQTPALTLHREAGHVRGLGVADVKLDYLCKVFGLRQIDLAKLRRPVRLLGTFCEEVGLVGARHFVDTHLARIKPEWVLCGEPSELLPCPAHKGYAAVRVTVRSTAPSVRAALVRKDVAGKAAHSSTPHLGINAITEMLRTLTGPVAEVSGGTSPNTVPASASALTPTAAGEAREFIDLSAALQTLRAAYDQWCGLALALQPARAEDFEPATVVNNWGQIEGKDGAVWGIFDARLLPEHDPLVLLEPFIAANPSLQIEVLRDNPGMRAKPTSRLIPALTKVLEAMGKNGTPRAKPTSTEAGVFARAGCDAAVTGPGVSIGNAHTANEWNSETDLEAAIELYRRLVLELCG